MKKILSVLLSALMLASLLISCAEEPSGTDTSGMTSEITAGTPDSDDSGEANVPENLSDTPARKIMVSFADNSSDIFQSSLRGYELVLEERTSADDIIQKFVEKGYYNYPVDNIEGSKLTTNFLLGAKSTVAVHFNKAEKEVRIVCEDRENFDHTVLQKNEATDTGGLQFVQVGVDRVSETDNPLNGMIHIAKLSDGRAIIVDGGFENERNAKNIGSALEKLDIKKNADGDFVIALWIITHAHSDHVGGATKFINTFGDSAEVETFMFSFNDNEEVIGSKQSTIGTFERAINRAYPNARKIVPHANIKYYFGNATISVLYTPELVYKAGKALAYYNDSSLIFKLSVGNTSVFEMGDGANVACGAIAESYDRSALKSDILQITHHGLYTSANSGHIWSNVNYVYKAVDAKLAIMGMHSKYGSDQRNGRFTVMGQWSEAGHQISYVMDLKDKPFTGSLTQAMWDEFETAGTINGVKVSTLYGYDGINTVTKATGMVTYLGGNRDEPMATVFSLDGSTVSVIANQTFKSWIN